jgi:regulatory protein
MMLAKAVRKERKWTESDVFAKVLRLCNVRERSAAGMLKRLAEDGIPNDISKLAIDRAIACGLIDDKRFAEAYVRSKLALGWGKRRIERELEGNGIDPSQLECCPEGCFTDESELERAMGELGRFHTSARNPQEARFRRLHSKGYDVSVIKKALAAYEEE